MGQLTAPNRSRDLIADLRQGQVVLFAGAGVSLGTHGQMGLPSANALTREMAVAAGFCGAGNCWNFDSISRQCGWDSGCANGYSETAEHYAATFGRPALTSFLRERVEPARIGPLRTHRAIARLPFKTIVTTNWDRLLEDALKEQGKQTAVVVENYEVAFANQGDVLLIKLHGSIDRPQSIIVTENDYEEFFDRLPGLVDLLLYFFATRTLLFVGYSLSDPNFRRLYLQVTRHLRDRYGRVFRPIAYANERYPSAYHREFWARHNLRVIDEDATVFLETLLKAVG